MQIALSGSRHFSPFAIAPVLKSVMQSSHPGITWVIGCCRGLDQTALALARSSNLKYIKVTAVSQQPEHLRARTIKMVNMASALVAFPLAMQTQSSGTWLAVKTAALKGIPVFVHAPAFGCSQLPRFANITGWQKGSANFAPGLQFWVPIVSAVQLSLF